MSTLLEDLVQVSVDRLKCGVGAPPPAEIPTLRHVEHLVRAAGAVLGILESGWADAQASLFQGVERRYFVHSVRAIQSPLKGYLEVCEALRPLAVALPGPAGRSLPGDLEEYKRRAQAILSEATPLLAWAEKILPLPDEATLRERARQADEAGAWVDFDAALAELKGAGGD